MKKTELKNLELVIKKLKTILKIGVIKIKFNSSKNGFDTKTNTIFLMSGKNELDNIFFVAHELRHVYQYLYEPALLENYKERSFFNDVNDYNNQDAELDANGFATAFVLWLTSGKIKPIFSELSENVKNKIFSVANLQTKMYFQEKEKEKEKELN